MMSLLFAYVFYSKNPLRIDYINRIKNIGQFLLILYFSWEPLPNLRSALVGYDLPTGNPYASDFIEDPGLKKQIFNTTAYSGYK